MFETPGSHHRSINWLFSLCPPLLYNSYIFTAYWLKEGRQDAKRKSLPIFIPQIPSLKENGGFLSYWEGEGMGGWTGSERNRDISGYWEGSELEPELSFLGLSTQEGKDLGGAEMWETKFAEKNSWPSWDLWGICGSGVRELGGRIHCRPRSRIQCQE